MQPCKSLHPRPSPIAATTLTAPSDHRQPESCDFIDETAQALAVVRDGVIIQPALHNTPQPATLRHLHSLRFGVRGKSACTSVLLARCSYFSGHFPRSTPRMLQLFAAYSDSSKAPGTCFNEKQLRRCSRKSRDPPGRLDLHLQRSLAIIS